MDVLILTSRLLARKYPLPGTARSVLSLGAALAVIVALVAGLNLAARNWKSENVARDKGMPSQVLAETP